jgi:hypothetical protein
VFGWGFLGWGGAGLCIVVRVLCVWFVALGMRAAGLVFLVWAWYRGSFLGEDGWGLSVLTVCLGVGFIALGNACGFLVLVLLSLVLV